MPERKNRDDLDPSFDVEKEDFGKEENLLYTQECVNLCVEVCYGYQFGD